MLVESNRDSPSFRVSRHFLRPSADAVVFRFKSHNPDVF